MAKLKIVLWGVVAGLILLGAGWVWGASGRWDAEANARVAQLHVRAADARGALALARVDLFELNYGQASRHLQQAKAALDDVSSRLQSAGQKGDADTALREAIAKTVQAQQLAGSVDTSANQRAAEALQAFDRAALPPPAR